MIRFCAAALAGALLLAAPAARALDPRFVWETLEAPHFQVHYHQGEYALALKYARLAEESHRRLAPLLDHEPAERCQLVIQDDTDFANGNATPLLYDLIHAYAPPPDSRSTLGDFDDPQYELISHEYTHILHLDTVLGLPEAFNSVFGKLWITNGSQPLWFIEGMATFAESEISGAGRVRSSSEDMMVRAEVLQGAFPRLDRLSNAALQWPRGFGQYTVGSRFLTWIKEEYGLGALRDLSHDFGARAIPLGMNLSSQHTLGKTYLQLYDEFHDYELERGERIRDGVRAAGESRIETLTHLGEWTRTPRFSRDGRELYYANAGPDRHSEIRALPVERCCDALHRFDGATLPGDRHVATLFADSGDDTLAVAPDGRIVYARAQIYQEYEVLQDLYAVDPKSGEVTRLTRGLRARGPDVARDGGIVFVWRRTGGRTAIAELAPGATEPRVLFEDPALGPVDSPRVSPDGTQVAFLHHRDGAWDLRLVPRQGGEPRDVTRDRALDRDPSFSPDGKWLFFSSDRTGVYDVYAYALATGETKQVTNVVFGAFEPEASPDGTQLALVTYSARGYDVARMPLDPAAWRAAPASEAEEARPPVAPLPADDAYPSHPYSPWETLRPHAWLPYAGTDALGTTLGLVTLGFDAVDRHEYAATLWYGLSSDSPGFSVQYTNRTFYPELTLSLSRDVGTADYPARSGARPGSFFYERETGGGATSTFFFSQVERAHALALNYSLFALTDLINPEHRPTSTGRLASATLSYSYSDAFRFVRSISSEEGQRFSVNLRLSDPALGSSFSFWQLSTAASKYLRMPWATDGVPWHHALALRASFGISHGDLSERHVYFLGGFQQGDPIRAVTSPASAPVRILRGYRNDAFAGEAYALGTAEYRFPLFAPSQGAWTLPFMLRRVHAAAFTDVGDAFTPRLHDFHLHAGAGLELRAEVVLGWVLPTDVRFGCAHGLEQSPESILDCYAALGGVF